MPRTSNLPYQEPLQEAALKALKRQRSRIGQQFAEIEQMLGRRRGRPSVAREQRELSLAAQKRIAAAQNKRWAEYRKNGWAAKGE